MLDRILLTNDDGIDAPGLGILEAIAQQLGREIWIVAPEHLMSDLALVSMGNVVVPVGIAQTAVAVALEAGDGDVAAATATWQARRDLILQEMEGLPVMRPAGGWSLLVDAEPLDVRRVE